MDDERRPVLVGVGQVRGDLERTVEGAREPLALMLDAIRAAAADGGIAPQTVDEISTVHVSSRTVRAGLPRTSEP